MSRFRVRFVSTVRVERVTFPKKFYTLQEKLSGNKLKKLLLNAEPCIDKIDTTDEIQIELLQHLCTLFKYALVIFFFNIRSIFESTHTFLLLEAFFFIFILLNYHLHGCVQ